MDDAQAKIVQLPLIKSYYIVVWSIIAYALSTTLQKNSEGK